MVVILSNPLHLQSSPNSRGQKARVFRQGEGKEGSDEICPPVFELAHQKWKPRFCFFLSFFFFILQRKSWFLYLSGRRVEPPGRAPHAGLTLADPRIRPRSLEAFRKPLGRLSRSGRGTARTLAALPASARPAVWASRVRAPREPGRTDRRRSPESPDGSGTRRLGGERANVKPRRTTPCTAGRRLFVRSQSVFSNRLVLTRLRLLPPPGSGAPPLPRSRDLRSQSRAAGGRVQTGTPRPSKRGCAGSWGRRRKV